MNFPQKRRLLKKALEAKYQTTFYEGEKYFLDKGMLIVFFEEEAHRTQNRVSNMEYAVLAAWQDKIKGRCLTDAEIARHDHEGVRDHLEIQRDFSKIIHKEPVIEKYETDELFGLHYTVTNDFIPKSLNG